MLWSEHLPVQLGAGHLIWEIRKEEWIRHPTPWLCHDTSANKGTSWLLFFKKKEKKNKRERESEIYTFKWRRPNIKSRTQRNTDKFMSHIYDMLKFSIQRFANTKIYFSFTFQNQNSNGHCFLFLSSWLEIAKPRPSFKKNKTSAPWICLFAFTAFACMFILRIKSWSSLVHRRCR